MRWLGFGFVLLLMAAAPTRPASACTGPCSSPAVRTTASGHVAAGGTLLIDCYDCTGNPAPFEAVSESGQISGGSVEVVAVSDEPTWLVVAGPVQFLRWKPNQPLAAGKYRLRPVNQDAYCSMSTSDHEWIVPETAQPAGDISVQVELLAESDGIGKAYECSDFCDPRFTYTRRGEIPVVRMTPQLSAADPRFATHVVRLVAESSQGDTYASWTTLNSLRSAERDFTDEETLRFRERRSEYCVALELFDTITDRHERIGRTCVSDTLGDLRSEASYSTCTAMPARADFDRAFCDDNREECRDARATQGCRRWQEVCNPADAGMSGAKDAGGNDAGEPGAVKPDAGSEESAAGEPDAGDADRDAAPRGNAKPATKDRGGDCSISAGRGQPPDALGWLLVLGAIVVRARRRVRPASARISSRA